MKYKLFNLEKDVARKESKWRRALQKMIELITIYHNIKSHNFDYRDVEITFVRALPHNETETADMISKLVGLVPQRTLLAQLDFIEDPEHEMKVLEDELTRQTLVQQATAAIIANNKNPFSQGNLKPNELVQQPEVPEENDDDNDREPIR